MPWDQIIFRWDTTGIIDKEGQATAVSPWVETTPEIKITVNSILPYLGGVEISKHLSSYSLNSKRE